jgi:hypothetical protein
MFASKDELFTRPSGGYTIGKSVRLRSSASAYLSRTPASNGNRQIFTWSGWVKRGTLGSRVALFNSGDTGSGVLNGVQLLFFGDNTITAQATGGTTINLVTSALYRDPSAWYHIVFAVDTTQATASNRVKIYVNGSQITSFSTATYPSQNQNFDINNTLYPMKIGASVDTATTVYYYDGYMTEINYVDGQQLTQSSFGSTDAKTGIWQPAKYTGTYGTNGFYLNFSSNGTAAALGTDFSGNSNTWTVNNISVTAGVTYDSMTDVPTLTSATAANYAVLNPLVKAYGAVTFANGNLQGTATTADWDALLATIAVTSGKFYWECSTTTTDTFFGIQSLPQNYAAQNPQNFTGTIVYYAPSGNTRIDGTATAYGATYGNGDVIGVALDITGGTITFYKNNTSQGSISLSSSSSMVGKTIVPVFIGLSNTITVNFGQQGFVYTPPTGYVALNTYNLPTSTIVQGNKYMDATLWTGAGGTQTISGLNFQPDFIWGKARSAAYGSALFDSNRGFGSTKGLVTSLTQAEGTVSAQYGYISTNTSTGFTATGGTDGSNPNAALNESGVTYVGWQWKAGGTAVSNTSGSITSQVSANTTAGFSVVTYTGNGTAGATVGHGLGVAPQFIIAKSRSIGASNWLLYHVSLTGTQYLTFTTAAATTNNGAWYNTTPTSSVFTIGGFGDINTSSATYVAYCFAPVAGYSAFGSYTGNGSTDGPFVYCGFQPRWIMVKQSSAAGEDWLIQDTSRKPYNTSTTGVSLAADTSGAEVNSSAQLWDVLSNGFKLRATGGGINSSGATYIYAAFASNPFSKALAF